MEFTKISITDKGMIDLAYDRDATRVDRVKMQCEEAAKRSFYTALQALNEDVVKICDLSDGICDVEEATEKLNVRCVKIKENEDYGIGVSIMAFRELPLDLEMTVTTPWLFKEGQGTILQPNTLTRIYALIKEAEDYVNGERLQGKLEL